MGDVLILEPEVAEALMAATFGDRDGHIEPVPVLYGEHAGKYVIPAACASDPAYAGLEKLMPSPIAFDPLDARAQGVSGDPWGGLKAEITAAIEAGTIDEFREEKEQELTENAVAVNL